MTHSNHRRGSRESLMGDWVIFMAGSRDLPPSKRDEFTRILLRHNPMGLTTYDQDTRRRYRYVKSWDKTQDSGIHRSAALQEIASCKSLGGGSGVFEKYSDAKAVVQEVVEADLGASIVVSGLFDKVHEALRDAGRQPHTVNMSGGTFGRTDLLPEPQILEITSMCGHHMVSSGLVKHLMQSVKQGTTTIDAAAVEMAKQCTCNFFNVERAKKLLVMYA